MTTAVNFDGAASAELMRFTAQKGPEILIQKALTAHLFEINASSR